MGVLAEAVGASIHRTELSLSTFLAGFALGQLLFGPLSDRIGRKPVLLGGLVVFLMASLLITQVNTLPELLAWRFVQALGGGATRSEERRVGVGGGGGGRRRISNDRRAAEVMDRG